MPTHIADLTGNNSVSGMTKGMMQKGMPMRNRSPSLTRAATSFVPSSSLHGGLDNDYFDRNMPGDSTMMGMGVSFDSDEGSLDGFQHQGSSKAFSKSEKSFFSSTGVQGLGQGKIAPDNINQLFPNVKGSLSQSPQSLSPLGTGNGNGGMFTSAINNGNGSLTPGVFTTTNSGMSSGEILKAAGEGKISPDKASLFEDSPKKKGAILSALSPTLSPTERRQAKLRLLGTANNA